MRNCSCTDADAPAANEPDGRTVINGPPEEAHPVVPLLFESTVVLGRSSITMLIGPATALAP